MLQQNLLIQKSRLSEVSLEGFEKLIFSCLDYLIFLLNPQLLHLIRFRIGPAIHEMLFFYIKKPNSTFLGVELGVIFANR
jgi:hypothetical protein